MRNTEYMQTNLYESDFYAWTIEQARLLEQRKLEHLDFDNLIEEITSLGKQQRQEFRNRLGILIGHLLKWDYQPEKRSKSWVSTIREQRREIKLIIDENPSLKSYLEEAMKLATAQGLDLVVRETPLSYRNLPTECPYSLEQIFDDSFPRGVADY